ANTITFNVTSVNDAPSGANKTLSVQQSTPTIQTHTFTQSDFGMTDVKDSPANGLLNVIITAGYPNTTANGTLSFNGTPFTTGTISAADIDAGKLVFTAPTVPNASDQAFSLLV